MDSEDELAAVLLLATGGLGRRTRKYVREAHDDNQNLRFARFRLYDNFGEAELEAYVRLKPNMFEMLLRRIGPQLARSRTHRYPLDPQKRLIVFLRYLTTGLTFSHLAQEVVFVAIILHNFLRNQTIDDSDEVVDGIPEDQIEDEEDNETQSSTSSETALREGESVREKFRQYFNSSLGFVPL
ncbi:hypothetical protein QR680_014814 [Steinernema hermaphroditum]|uniref:DDE Tnp4 domain-containing protein n=1 Tax=Steinernema hermaphroditum TaxID=289476 RepID=A0AA39IBS6_9BILA|nr:hypothetical protein QR680_014814 [Steinernema hermaphroditum]